MTLLAVIGFAGLHILVNMEMLSPWAAAAEALLVERAGVCRLYVCTIKSFLQSSLQLILIHHS